MTEPEHQILQSLRSGPKSLTELWQRLNATITLSEMMDALWGLYDGKKVDLMPAVGLWKLGVAE